MACIAQKHYWLATARAITGLSLFVECQSCGETGIVRMSGPREASWALSLVRNAPWPDEYRVEVLSKRKRELT